MESRRLAIVTHHPNILNKCLAEPRGCESRGPSLPVFTEGNPHSSTCLCTSLQTLSHEFHPKPFPLKNYTPPPRMLLNRLSTRSSMTIPCLAEPYLSFKTYL